ncbi:hypothetical protein K449DRAFT_430210 [Hypoxylon sp. EC38]|nr:hypothetical protein K449DRAFT_430210 [Hypoxylon sp. EC38]
MVLLDIWNISSRLSRGNPLKLSIEHDVYNNRYVTSLQQELLNGKVVFVSLDVHAWDIDQDKITDIGVSIWHPRTPDGLNMLSYHWQIKDNMFLKNRYVPNEPYIFTFGNTEVVSQNQIAAILNDVFEYSSRLGRMIIVGHDIHSTVRLLAGHWKPESVTFLDTEKIFQIQHRCPEKVPLKTALNTTSRVRYIESLLNNAGNDARFIIYLLQTQFIDARSEGDDSEKVTSFPKEFQT